MLSCVREQVQRRRIIGNQWFSVERALRAGLAATRETVKKRRKGRCAATTASGGGLRCRCAPRSANSIPDAPAQSPKSSPAFRLQRSATWSLPGVSESASAEFSFFTPSAPPSTYTFELTRTWGPCRPIISSILARRARLERGLVEPKFRESIVSVSRYVCLGNAAI